MHVPLLYYLARAQAVLIEVAARAVIGVDDSTINNSLSLLRRGIIKFPQSVYLRLQYCHYLLRARNQTDAAANAIQQCERLHLDMDQAVKVLLLRREAVMQARAKQMQGNGNLGEGFNEIELKQRLIDAKALYLKCQKLMAEVWTILQKDSLRQDRSHGRKRRNQARVAAAALKAAGGGRGSNKVVPVDDKGKQQQQGVKKRSSRHRKASAVGDDGGRDTDVVDDVGDTKQAKPGIKHLQEALTATLAGATLSRVLVTLEKLRDLERKADALFEVLLVQCPDSPEVLHEYAQYVRGVKLDEAGARELDMRRDMAIVTKETAAKREVAASAALFVKRQYGADSDDSSSPSGSDSSTDEAPQQQVQQQQRPGSSSSNMPPSPSSATTNITPLQTRQSGLTIKVENKSPLRINIKDEAGDRDDDSGDSSSLEIDTASSRADNRRHRRRQKTDSNDETAAAVEADKSGGADEQSSHSSDSSSMQSAEHAVMKERKDMQMAVTARVKKLRYRLRVSSLLLLGVASALLWVFVSLAKDAEISTTDVDFGGRRRFGCAEIAFQSRQMHIAATKNDVYAFNNASARIMTICDVVGGINTVLSHERSVRTSRLRDFYDTGNVKVREVRSSATGSPGASVSGAVQEVVVSGSQAMERMLSAGLVIANSNMTAFAAYNKSNPATFPELFFALDNAAFVFRAMDTASILTLLETDNTVFICVLIAGCLCGAALVVEWMIVLNLFRPTVQEVFVELGTSAHRLGTLDRADRSAMASRFRAVQEEAETQAYNRRTEEQTERQRVKMHRLRGGNDNDRAEKEQATAAAKEVLRQQHSQQQQQQKQAVADWNGVASQQRISLATSSSLGSRFGQGAASVRFAAPEDIELSQGGSRQASFTTTTSSVIRQGLEPPTSKEPLDTSVMISGSGVNDASSTTESHQVAASIHRVDQTRQGVTSRLGLGSRYPTFAPIASLGASGASTLPNGNNSSNADINSNGAGGADDKKAARPSSAGDSSSHEGSGTEYDTDDSQGSKRDGEKGSNKNKNKNKTRSKTQQDRHDSNLRMSKDSMKRRTVLELWYYLCLGVVTCSFVIVFSLGYSSTVALSAAARLMNNITRRQGMLRGLTWLTLELVSCYDDDSGMCGGLQRVSTSEDSIRCYMNEMILAVEQVHNGDLLGSAGWDQAMASSKTIKTDWNTPCSLLTEQQDLYDLAKDLGVGAMKFDPRMNKFMFTRGVCLASPGELEGISSLSQNERTREELRKFSDSKCELFNSGDRQTMLGLARLIDDMLLNYRVLAYTSLKSASGVVSVPATAYGSVVRYTETSEEWSLGLIKGAMLMEATVFQTTLTNAIIVSSAYAVVALVALVQLFWLGNRVHGAIEDNIYVVSIVSRMLRAAAAHKKAVGGTKSARATWD